MQEAYRDDLAYIHDVGFGQFARGGAAALIEQLRQAGVLGGTVVDLGCGSGITALALSEAGYSVTGFDVSPAMIALARRRVPQAQFQLQSCLSAALPICVAVSAIGEVLNYSFDPANASRAREQLLRRIHQALTPGGLLMFDVATAQRVPTVTPQRNFFEGEDWSVLVEVSADEAKTLLTRRIVTFRKNGEGYERDTETHRLQLFDAVETMALLQDIGFSVRMMSRYGSEVLPKGLIGFLARKRTR